MQRVQRLALQVKLAKPVAEPAASPGAYQPADASQADARAGPNEAGAANSAKKVVSIGWDGFGFYEAHAMWLRDACRDDAFVKASAGERLLGNCPVNTLCWQDPGFAVASMEWKSDGDALEVSWTDGHSGTFSKDFLQAYLPVVGRRVSGGAGDGAVAETALSAGEDAVAFIRPYMHSSMGGPSSGTLAPAPDMIRKWGGKHGFIDYETLPYERVHTAEGNLELLKVLLRDGAVKIGGVPVPPAAEFANPATKKAAVEGASESLLHAVEVLVGGLQKDPSREEPNWVIERRPEAASVSYNPDLRLNNHTDQSLPNHGVPGLLLCVLYADGQGENTLVDGFAVCEHMEEEDARNGTEYVKLLSTYGNGQLRDVAASRQDAAQRHKAGLQLYSERPILQRDGDGNVFRLQYNEVFRQPCEVPFDVFPEFYRAYARFVELIHSPEFEVRFPVAKGQMMLVQNWRVMHGRNGNMDGTPSHLQSTDRLITGGTVTRESVVSRARQLIQKVHGKTCYGPNMLFA